VGEGLQACTVRLGHVITDQVHADTI
jgi:hypothetical protein